MIDELEADGRRAEARVAPRLGGAEVERRDEAGRPRVHAAAVQVAHGEARVQHATAVIAGGAEVNLEGVGLRLAQRAGHQRVGVKGARRGILDEVVGDAVGCVAAGVDGLVDERQLDERDVGIGCEERLGLADAAEDDADVEERRPGDDAVVVVGEPRGLNERHAAAVGAAVEVGAIDAGRIEEGLHHLLAGHRHVVHGAEVVVDHLRRVGHPGRCDRPAGVGEDAQPVRPVARVAGVGDGGGIALLERETDVDGVRRRERRAGQAAGAEEEELALPVGRQLDVHERRAVAGPLAARGDGREHVAVLRVGRGRRNVGRGQDRHVGDAQRGQRGHRARHGRRRGGGDRDRQQDDEGEKQREGTEVLPTCEPRHAGSPRLPGYGLAH